MEKERGRYSLIIVTKTGLMYCYNPSCDHFERIFDKSGEIKTTLPKIDQITCIFDNQEALAEYYGIEDEVQYSCVKYYQSGPVLLRPAYNNEKWIPVAHSCVGYKLDLDSNEYNRKIFFELYDAIIERDDFSRFIVHSDETKFKFSKKLTYTLYTIIAHEKMLQLKYKYESDLDYMRMVNFSEEDKNIKLANRGQLKDYLRHYRELRALYFTYCNFMASQPKKQVNKPKTEPKKKVKEPKDNSKTAVVQISMFDGEEDV